MAEAEEKSHSFLKALLGLLPFFLLHISRFIISYFTIGIIRLIFSGLSGSFTTVLIDHFRTIKLEDSSKSLLYETLLGTFEDYAPILVAVLGGFLQTLFGPKKILIAAAIPGFLSWVLVIINPDSIFLLLGSRLLAGFSNGLLTGNVYMPDVAPSKFISSFKSIEVFEKNCCICFI